MRDWALDRQERLLDGRWRSLTDAHALLLALAVAFVQVVGSVGASNGQPEREPLDALAVALLLTGPALLVVRKRFPVAVFLGVVAVTLAYLMSGYAYGPVFISLIVAIYTTVIAGHRLVAWAGVAGLYVVHVAFLETQDERLSVLGMFAVAAWLLVVLVGSEVARAYRERSAERALVRAEEARRHSSEERLRIARELHDVLAHHISLMNVQAGVALHLMDRRPEQARTALSAIEAASREAMGELRSVLDILRNPEEAAPRAPAPSLSRLESLRSRAEAAGLEVRLETHGDPVPLSAAQDAAAYRVVQESITNVIRHASATRATVVLTYGGHTLAIAVRDDGTATPPQHRHRGDSDAGSGNGLAGMRERVEALGGWFDAGPRAAGGFEVRATLPVGNAGGG